jgi:hypothetical protein
MFFYFFDLRIELARIATLRERRVPRKIKGVSVS